MILNATARTVALTLVLLACASEYGLQKPAEPPPEVWATVATCPGYAALWLPLEGIPVAVSWCSAAEECGPTEWSVGRWLYATCPDAGELRVLWTDILSQDTGGA